MDNRSFYIDNKEQLIKFDDGTQLPMYSPEGFRHISDLYVKVGWDQKYVYSFSWLGRPIIQLPEDLIRIQEVIYSLQPDVVIETGIAHGGSLIFYASVLKAMGKGKVVGVDIDIRSHNRKAMEEHELAEYITMIEGSSIEKSTVELVQGHVKDQDKVLVLLDSCHDYDHVLEELKLYSPLVSVGSYIVATDGSQEYLNVTPRAKVDYPQCGGWDKNNPKRAALDFVRDNDCFEISEPAFPFNEGPITDRITHWPSGYIKRIK